MPLTVGELLALIRADDSQFRRAVDGAERKLVTSAGRMQASTEKLRGVLGKVAGILLTGAGLAVFASLAGLAVGNVAGLVVSLGSLLGLLAAVPALVGAGAAAFAALKIGLSGVADALKGDEEALAKLAPEARAVVQEIRGLDGAWQDVRRTVQGGLFAPLMGQVSALARTWLPLLRLSLGQIATEFGLMGREAATAARDPGFVSNIGAALGWLRDMLRANRGAVGDLVAALGILVGASVDVLGVSGGFADAAASFREWAAAAASTGQFAVWWETAKTVAAQFGDVLVQVGGILAAVGKAAQEAGGGGPLAVLVEILRGVNAALSSAEGQTALVGIFAAMRGVVGPVVEILTTLIREVGPVVPVVLGALAEALRALVPAAVPVGQAIAAIARALAPVLPLIGNVLVVALTAAAGMLQVLAAEWGPLIDVLSQAGVAILQALLPAITQLIEGGLPMAIALGQAFFAALAPLVPVLVELATQFLSAVIPALTQLQAEMSGQLLPVLIQVAAQLGGVLLQALRDLAPHIPGLAAAAVEFARAFVELVKAGLPLLPLLTEVLALVIGSGGLESGVKVLTLALHLMAAGLGVASFALGVTIGLLRSSWEWAKTVADAIADGFRGALDWIGQLPGRIQSMFASAGSWLADAGGRIVDGLIDGIRGAFGRVRDTLAELTSLLPDWKGPAAVDRRILAPSGRLLVGGLVDGIRDALPSLRAALGSVTVDLPSMVGSPQAAIAGGVDTARLVAAVRVAGGGTDAATIARAVRAAMEGMAVELDGHAVGRIQGRDADLLFYTEF